MAFEQVKTNVSKNRKQMHDLQNQAATQKRVTKPSDDPLAASRVLGEKVDLAGKKQFIKSLSYAKSYLDFTDQSLGEMADALMRVKELALSQSNDASAGPETRRVVATEVGQLYDQMVQVGNRKMGERFIFGGFKTTSSPFDYNGEYKGDNGEIKIHIDKDSFISMNLPGNQVFLGEGLGEDGVSVPMKEQPRTIEQFKAEQKTQIENQEFDPNGHPELRGPASIDGDPQFPWSEQNTPENLSPETKNVNTVNIFSVLKDLEISLKANDKEGVQDSLEQIDKALSQVVLARSQVGSRSSILENYSQSIEKAKVDNQISISQLEDADIFATVSDINKTESTLQATLQTSGNLIQKSLLDFLR
jgi:flagellar hook-associated protein 3 FlgL